MTAVLLAHYGSVQAEALEKTAFALEKETRAAFSDWEVGSCFTGERMPGHRGRPFLPVHEALEQLWQKGCRRVLIQPTHLTPGTGYAKLRQAALLLQGRFEELVLGAPLLGQMETIRETCGFLAETFLPKAWRAVAFVGHGGPASKAYRQLAGCFQDRGRTDVSIGLLKGEPGADRLGRSLWQAGFREILLAPLLFSAGVHASRDIAGAGPESWKSRLEGQGFAVQAVSAGLGEYPAVRRIYLERIRQLAGGYGNPSKYQE